jgi:iron(III) transport system substrate-binding protein
MLTRRSLLRLVALAPFISGRVASAQDADWKKVVDAAKKEGKVVVYNGAVGTPALPKAGAAFEAKYGVRMELLEARASELRERIRTEQASGKILGDVSHNGSTTTALQLGEGTFQPHGPLPNGKRPVAPFTVDDIRVPIYVIPYGILVNTDMVKPADEPKAWNDLLNPRWKGKILSDDMRALGGGAVFFMVMMQKFGKEFHEKLAQQQPHMNRDLRGNYPRVARGEYPVYAPFTMPDVLELKGLPVKAIMPPEGLPYVRFDGAMFKGAPHPNAARLFMDFLLSDEGQLAYGNLGFMPVVGGLESRITGEAKALVAQFKLLGTTDPKLQDDMLKLAKAIYK